MKFSKFYLPNKVHSVKLVTYVDDKKKLSHHKKELEGKMTDTINSSMDIKYMTG